MNPTSQVIQFIYDKTKGLVNLSIKDADQLIKIITTPVINTGCAKKYLYNAQTSIYDFIRAIPITQLQIDAAIMYALETGPSKQSYYYELINANGESEGIIYTINASLFD